MTDQFEDTLAGIPSVQEFLGQLADDLTNRRSIVVLLPAGVDPALVWASLHEELVRRDFWVAEVSVPSLPRDQPAPAAIGESVGAEWSSAETPRTTANLVRATGLPEIVYLEGLHESGAKGLMTWPHLVTQWSQAGQALADSGRLPPALCVILPAAAVVDHIPETGLHLAVHWWWGFPSALELRLLCRLGSRRTDTGTNSRWREHVLPSVAASDLLLFDYMWDKVHLSTEELAELLLSFAERRGWQPGVLTAWGAKDLLAAEGYDRTQDLASPPTRWRELWAHGALVCTPEYGVELHAAALAALDRRDELRHRLWRGQAELLLPLVDHLRLLICSHLTRSHGQDWPVRWYQPQSTEEEAEVRENPLACGWGYLVWLLWNCRELRPNLHWGSLARRAHQIRNKLAHYKPVTLTEFEGLWRELQRVSTQVTRGR